MRTCSAHVSLLFGTVIIRARDFSVQKGRACANRVFTRPFFSSALKAAWERQLSSTIARKTLVNPILRPPVCLLCRLVASVADEGLGNTHSHPHRTTTVTLRIRAEGKVEQEAAFPIPIICYRHEKRCIATTLIAFLMPHCPLTVVQRL